MYILQCANIVSTFSCIPGPFGGNFSTDFSEFCGSQQYPLPDWHLFLCIQFLNTPDLGLFYPIDTNIVRDTASFELVNCCFISLYELIKVVLFYLCLYPPDLQESNGGANT